MSELTYKIQGSRVYGDGNSFNCTNTINAQELCNKLNELEKCKKEYHDIQQKLDKVNKDITGLQMTMGIMSEELTSIKEKLQWMT